MKKRRKGERASKVDNITRPFTHTYSFFLLQRLHALFSTTLFFFCAFPRLVPIFICLIIKQVVEVFPHFPPVFSFLISGPNLQKIYYDNLFKNDSYFFIHWNPELTLYKVPERFYFFII